VLDQVDRVVNSLGAGRVLVQQCSWTDRSGDKCPPAVRTHAQEHGVDARSTERAFKAAHPSLGRIRREVGIAMLAIGLEDQHRVSSSHTG
jgi:hypothetical protein